MATRAEALAKAMSIYGSNAFAAGVIDLWVSLGMLKLDEPKLRWTPNEIARDVIEHYYFPRDFEKTDSLIQRLDIAGLKIVEK